MASRFQKLNKENRVNNPPKWLADNIQYEVLTGSVAYGVSTDYSDEDIYGYAIPPKTDVFPHLQGHIMNFGKPYQPFEQFQQHHIKDKNKEYDLTIYSIVKFFNLCMQNNPNMVDCLFVPERCVLFCTPLARHVRNNRQLFLHKGSYHKFRGYAYAQLHKIGKDSKNIKKVIDFQNKYDILNLNVEQTLEKELQNRGLIGVE